MQDERAIVDGIVRAGREGSPYSTESSAEHKSVLALVDRYGTKRWIGLADYGFALKALSEGEFICLTSQIGKNVKYAQSVKATAAVNPETDRVQHQLRQITESLKENLRRRNKQATAARRQRQREETERVVEERRRLARERDARLRQRQLEEQEKRHQEQLCLDRVRDKLCLWDSLIRGLEAELKYETELPTPELKHEDRELARLWLRVGQEEDAYHVARVLSARAAEKVAAEVYERSGASVFDLSIAQLTEKNKCDWTKFDLLVDGVPVDVKNSRPPINSPDNYTEHCVPQFKARRIGEDVLIAGFLSPYLGEWEFDQRPSREEPVRYLGETSRSVIKALEANFSDEFFKIGFHRTERKGFFLPPWIFEYPPKFYRAMNTDRGEMLYEKSWPQKDEFDTFDINPLPLLSIWPPPEDFVFDGMESRLTRQVSRMLAGDVAKLGRSRPVIWMSLLTSVVDLMANDEHEEGWSPADVRRFVFFSDRKRPLGCYDPLETVSSLLKALDAVWKHAKNQMAGFKSFKLVNGVILKGRRESSDKWLTIIAYCGGRVILKDGSSAPCGKNPIYLGRETTCEECGKLICSECGFCMYDCTLLKSNRHAAKERKRERALVRGAGVLSHAEYLDRLFSSQQY